MARVRLAVSALILLAACTGARTPAPIVERGARPPERSTERPRGVGHYQVQAGDTLYGIAFARDLDFRALARLNDLAEPYLIRPGEWLRLPAEGLPVARTAPAPLPEAVMARALPARTVAVLPGKAADGSQGNAVSTPAQALPDAPLDWRWPAAGPLLAGFEPAAGRKGLDIGAARHAPVRAAAPGTVVYAGSALRGYGKLTIIRHGPALLSAYAHQAVQHVAEGQSVRGGEIIGSVGDSDAERVKLHFELREYGKPVDPRLFLPARSEYGPG